MTGKLSHAADPVSSCDNHLPGRQSPPQSARRDDNDSLGCAAAWHDTPCCNMILLSCTSCSSCCHRSNCSCSPSCFPCAAAPLPLRSAARSDPTDRPRLLQAGWRACRRCHRGDPTTGSNTQYHTHTCHSVCVTLCVCGTHTLPAPPRPELQHQRGNRCHTARMQATHASAPAQSSTGSDSSGGRQCPRCCSRTPHRWDPPQLHRTIRSCNGSPAGVGAGHARQRRRSGGRAHGTEGRFRRRRMARAQLRTRARG